MFLTRKEIINRNLKKLGEALVGGFLMASPFFLWVILLALGC